MRSPRSLRAPLLVVLLAPALALSQAPQEEPTWKNHNSLKDLKTFETDWAAKGQGQYRIENKAIRLLENSAITSRFRVVDDSTVKLLLTGQNRNIFLNVWDQKLDFPVPPPSGKHPGPHVYSILMTRKGSKLRLVFTATDRKGVPIVVQPREIILPATASSKSSPLTLSSAPVGGRAIFNQNAIADLTINGITITGKVQIP